MRLGTAIERLFDNYVYASDKEWIRDKVTWALYQTWKEAESRKDELQHDYEPAEPFKWSDYIKDIEVEPQKCYLKKSCVHYGDKQICGRCREYNLYSHTKTKPQEWWLTENSLDDYKSGFIHGYAQAKHEYESKTKSQTGYPCDTCANKGDHNGECSNCVADSERIRWKTPSHYKPKNEPQTDCSWKRGE